MNNSVYNLLYDSVVNTYLIQHCGLRPKDGGQYGLVGKAVHRPPRQQLSSRVLRINVHPVHSHNDYFSSIAFPAVAELALRVNKLGKSSVTYEVALFEQGCDEVKSVGEFVHVFVDRSTGRPNANGMDSTMRRGLERILVGGERAKL